MKAELKNKWIEALRSGNYEQGAGSLRTDATTDVGVSYCSLGVLVCVSGMYRPSFNPGSQKVYDWINGQIGRTTKWDLVWMNDRQRRTFAEIADYIEENI